MDDKPIPSPLFVWLRKDTLSPVVFENEKYSTLLLFKSPQDAEEFRSACITGTPEDTPLRGGVIETLGQLRRLIGALPPKVSVLSINPPPDRNAKDTVTGVGEFLRYAEEAVKARLTGG